MFSKLFGAIGNGFKVGKVSDILIRNYSLSAPEEDIEFVIRNHSDVANEHELAIWYLVNWVQHIYLDHPKAISEVTKYIKVAKKAARSGFVQNPRCGDILFAVIKDRFNVDASTIEAD